MDRVKVEKNYPRFRSSKFRSRYNTFIDYSYQVKDSIFENRAEETFFQYKIKQKVTVYYLKTNYQISTTKDSFWTFEFTIRFFYLFIALITLFTIYMAFLAFNEFKIKDDLK